MPPNKENVRHSIALLQAQCDSMGRDDINVAQEVRRSNGIESDDELDHAESDVDEVDDDSEEGTVVGADYPSGNY
jgi:hypothetical protein